jgi:hypothetical protein
MKVPSFLLFSLSADNVTAAAIVDIVVAASTTAFF